MMMMTRVIRKDKEKKKKKIIIKKNRKKRRKKKRRESWMMCLYLYLPLRLLWEHGPFSTPVWAEGHDGKGAREESVGLGPIMLAAC